jgi:hypothetical protein
VAFDIDFFGRECFFSTVLISAILESDTVFPSKLSALLFTASPVVVELIEFVLFVINLAICRPF